MVATANTAASSTTMRRRRRMVENYLVIWVDGNIDKTNEDCQNIFMQLRDVVNEVELCATEEQCIQHLNENKEKTAFVISSGALGQNLVPDIHGMPQLDAIYIFCGNKQRHESWAKNWAKIKGVHTSIKRICQGLQMTVKKCNQDNISVSIISVNEGGSNENLNQLEPTFVYSQIFKEILLGMEHNQQAIKELVTFCKEEYRGNTKETHIIEEFQRTYQPSKAIWWYTRECFTYKMLNQALRTLDGDIMIRMGFFIYDVHRQIESLHNKSASLYHGKTFQVYRGQGLSTAEFEKLWKNKGGLISFNNFLSTSKNRNLSLDFTKDALETIGMTGILFQITVNPTVSSTAFASIREVSYYHEEDEILFSMHTVFRIGDIRQLKNNSSLYQVDLKLTSDDDEQLHRLTDRIRQETTGEIGWKRLGLMLLKVGQFNKAEEFYATLLERTSDDNDKVHIYGKLGSVKKGQGQYQEAISFYEKSIAIYRKARPEDHSLLGDIYNNIGQAHYYMNDYSKTLEFYKKALKARENALPPNHPDLATSYNEIGSVYNTMKNYSKALEFYEKAQKIYEKTLPQNHPWLANSYGCIGSIYYNMGDYSKALEFLDKALKIKEKALPPDYSNLATSYNNIGLVYSDMADYIKALSFLEKALTIRQKTFPPTHPDIKKTIDNIIYVKKKM
ncbi:unnamed protein product [Rotaria sp. Silwood1]|nr:unnamed protein product [Rotaria sp. Silwood1]